MDGKTYDYLIVGAGIIGLALAFELKRRHPAARVCVFDKEADVAAHASGRNSGVLHAGFYYTAESLKARLTVTGNKALSAYCLERGLSVNRCGKLVVAQNQAELEKLYELERRGRLNGSNVRIVDSAEALELEPNVRTFKKALYSPDTASVDPLAVCRALKQDLINLGVELVFNCSYLGRTADTVETTRGPIAAQRIINCAGLYADKIAHDFGFGGDYTIIPFKGLYLKYTRNKTDVGMHIYPVPNLKNPFLGVHFTKLVDGTIKIGPTAIPALWRENYNLFSGFKMDEFAKICFYESLLFVKNSFGFRELAFEELKKYWKGYFIKLAKNMVQTIDSKGFGEYSKPGIRAQLLDRRSLSLVQDFVVQGDGRSVHVLNAVSPGLTCSFPFAAYVIDNYLE